MEMTITLPVPEPRALTLDPKYTALVVVDGALAYNRTYGRGMSLGRLPGCSLPSMGGTLSDALTAKNSTVHDVGSDGILVAGTNAPAGLGKLLATRKANGDWDSTGAKPKHTGSAA